MREAEQLAGHDLVETVEARDAVTEGGNGANLVDLHLRVVIRDLFAKELRNLVCLDLSHLKFLNRSQFAVRSALPATDCWLLNSQPVSAGDQYFLEALEAAADRTVVDGGADADDSAAEDGCVLGKTSFNTCAGQLADAFEQ